MKGCGWLLAAAAWTVCTAAHAQWTTQEIPLHEGWNAVCVRVEPTAGSLADLARQAGDGAVEGVWRWDKRFTSAEYVVDEASPLARDPHWKAWYPAEGIAFLSTLGGMSPWRCYLVKVGEGAGSKTVSLKGRVRLPRVEWYPNALNLVGFPVGENGVSFAEWFEADKAVDLSQGYGNAAWQIASDGTERVVAKPALQKLAAGEAAWVRCDGASSFAGPLAISAEGGEGLDFGAALSTIRLSIANLSSTRERTLVLSLVASEAAPEGEEQVAGAVPLHLAGDGGWEPFAGKTVSLAPGETWTGNFGVDRADMQYREETAGPGNAYQSILSVRDAEGKIAIDVPVRAVREAAGGAAESLDGVPASVHPQAGLWTGTATLTEVDCPSYQPGVPLPVRHAANLRLLVHVDAEGTARLLKEAWAVSGTNGMKLYARRELVPAGAEDVWRASTATLPAMDPLELGAAGLSGTLAGEVALAYDDPVNPFLHRYHPMYDNKNGQFEAYDGPVESRNVVRRLSLAVSEETAGLENPDEAVSGTYEERLEGLRAQEILVRGAFRLEKVLAGVGLVAE